MTAQRHAQESVERFDYQLIPQHCPRRKELLEPQECVGCLAMPSTLAGNIISHIDPARVHDGAFVAARFLDPDDYLVL
ncbi:hypothetical protein HFN97_24600 [Rhizobium laguerreae]|uniref:hypothetical protein n=1 Tax=Rhizobium laguerreae TaxID=1076926 RepID=UPI001C91BA3E|nr:hypothetical protein [Rhizobium laguerreae]MBY3360958.1 hypothetical protein [Rhizobium laguerreae]